MVLIILFIRPTPLISRFLTILNTIKLMYLFSEDNIIIPRKGAKINKNRSKSQLAQWIDDKSLTEAQF